MLAYCRLVVDSYLAKTDPARQPFEETIAFRHLAQGCRRACRQQAEIAGIFGNFVTRPPIQERIERANAGSPQPGFVLAVRLGSVDHVVTVIEPACNQW